MKINKTLVKNIVLAIVLPSSVLAVYAGYKFIDRKKKEKKILLEVGKHFDDGGKVTGMKEQVVSEWKKALSELHLVKKDEFTPFYNYFMATIPKGKTTITDGKDPSSQKSVWFYEKSNPMDFKILLDKYTTAISGKSIEKLFNALASEIK